MKVVPDSMLWVSYVTHRDGPRHAALNRSADQRVRLFTSKYIIEEVERILTDKFERPRRFVQLALQKILRMATEVELPNAPAHPRRPLVKRLTLRNNNAAASGAATCSQAHHLAVTRTARFEKSESWITT